MGRRSELENSTPEKNVDRKINVDDHEEVHRWCSELQCNEMRLKNAIRAVGDSEEAVRRYMMKRF
jgi:hypothetical protein